jgi:hypothetical protein
MDVKAVIAHGLTWGIATPVAVVGTSLTCAAAAVEGVARAVAQMAKGFFDLIRGEKNALGNAWNSAKADFTFGLKMTPGIIPIVGLWRLSEAKRSQADRLNSYFLSRITLRPTVVVCNLVAKVCKKITGRSLVSDQASASTPLPRQQEGTMNVPQSQDPTLVQSDSQEGRQDGSTQWDSL